MQTTTFKPQPSTEDFIYENHGSGAAAIAAKLIAQGKIISFDMWERVEISFANCVRHYKGTIFFGLENNAGDISARVSLSHNLASSGSHALIASWHGEEIATDPVHIASAIVSYMAAHKVDNYFLNAIT